MSSRHLPIPLRFPQLEPFGPPICGRPVHQDPGSPSSGDGSRPFEVLFCRSKQNARGVCSATLSDRRGSEHSEEHCSAQGATRPSLCSDQCGEHVPERPLKLKDVGGGWWRAPSENPVSLPPWSQSANTPMPCVVRSSSARSSSTPGTNRRASALAWRPNCAADVIPPLLRWLAQVSSIRVKRPGVHIRTKSQATGIRRNSVQHGGRRQSRGGAQHGAQVGPASCGSPRHPHSFLRLVLALNEIL